MHARSYTPSHATTRSDRGFSFVEVLFALMILSLGFIMIAGVFPVAIQQAQATSDETVSSAVAWNAFTLMQETLGDDDLPPMGWHGQPGVVRSFRNPQPPGVQGLQVNANPDNYVINGGPRFGSYRPQAISGDRLWQRVSADMIVADDPRYAWVGFYRRGLDGYAGGGGWGVWRNHAMLIVVVARVRDGTSFQRKDVSGPGSLNLQPRPVVFNLTSDGEGPVVDQVVVFTGHAKEAVSEGAFLVVAHDPTLNMQWASDHESGRVYRIGNHVEGDKWEISPESTYVAQFDRRGTVPGTIDIATGVTGASGFVVGRPVGAAGGYDGPAQDLAVYSLTIACRPQMPPP